MMTRRVVTLLVVLLSPYPLIAQGKNQRKELETKAKMVMEQGVSFQKGGRLLDARAKYEESLGIISTKAAISALHSINSAIQKRVASLLKDAKAQYDAMKLQEAIATLNRAVELQPGNAAVHYNLALCSAILGERAKAIDYLDQAIAALSNKEESETLEELKVALTTGEATPNLPDAEKAKVREFNQLSLKLDAGTLNEALDSPATDAFPERDTASAPKSKVTLCQRLNELRSSLPQSPAILFNLARCAEYEGKIEDAVKLFNQYLQTAPNAVDSPDVRLQIEYLQRLTTINDPKADEVRSLYASASRDLDARKYDRAIDAYHHAEILVPGFPQTKWRLALMYEMMGNTGKAREYFASYKALSPGSNEKTQADIHLNDLDNKDQTYREKAEDARRQLTLLLHRSIGLDTSVNPPVFRTEVIDPLDAPGQTNGMVAFDYVQSQLEQISKTLGAAYSIFPLAPEVNQMLGFVYLQGNNGTTAQHDFDAVASQKQPVSFYASLVENKDLKASRFVKIELDRDGLRAIDVAIPDAKSKARVLPSKPAGKDHLGNFVGSAKDGGGFSGLEAMSADVKAVETKDNAVVVTLPDKKLTIFPSTFTGDAPETGGAARKFANTYTRLFRDYLGIDDAKLGKEGMTGGEKFKLGMTLAGSVFSPAVAMWETFGEVRSMRINNARNANTSTLQQNLLEQRQILRENQFKLIPPEPAQLVYRENLQ